MKIVVNEAVLFHTPVPVVIGKGVEVLVVGAEVLELELEVVLVDGGGGGWLCTTISFLPALGMPLAMT